MDTQEARPEHYAGSSEANKVKEAALEAVAPVTGFQQSERKPERTTTHRKSSYDRGVQIAAAKLRVATDRRIGETTPDWIKELAAEKPSSRAS
jgi:hypothetical protein